VSGNYRKHSLTMTAILIMLFLGNACSLVPLSPRDSASSVGKGKVKIDTNLLPAIALNTTYGLTDNFDVGLDIENVTIATVWSRYSLLNNKTGVSVAATGGAFSHMDTDTNGLYAGALLSYYKNSKIRLAAGYRYNKVAYEPDDYGNIYDGYPALHNSEDLSETGVTNVSLAFRVKPHLQLTVGAVCQHHYKNRNRDIDSNRCRALLGFSFFSQ